MRRFSNLLLYMRLEENDHAPCGWIRRFSCLLLYMRLDDEALIHIGK